MTSTTFSIVTSILALMIVVAIGAFIVKIILNFSDLVLVLIILVLLMYVAHDRQQNHGKKDEKKSETKPTEKKEEVKK